ncbi:MAG: asparagine synthase (glutamine-hydrolyzing), partial [Acidobacteriota bacterium]
MCGLCGLFSPEAGGVADAEGAIRRMTRELERRGPDDEAFWLDPEARLRLGFRRLAILDLSPSGRQPMVSSSGDSVLVLNGEIYNFRELRRELEADGLRFRSTSDTEIALEALERWGLDALGRLEGMFALAFYDRRRRRLTLARDRTGIKPLWLLDGPSGLAFSSQLDSLLNAPWPVDAEPRPDVLHHYLRLGHIHAPAGLLPGTRQLEAGAWHQIDADGRRESGRFWRLPRRPEGATGAEEGVEAFDAALERAVERHRLADVPLGVFLSGGVDSPLVSAVARRQTSSELLAFTLGNPGWGQDEEAASRLFAGQLDLDHRVLRLDDAAAAAGVDQVRASMHEPFADFSLLPTLLLSAFAREQVTVALSGDGGDELFFGYERPRSLLRDGGWFRR